ncbi:MAG TPA: dihydrofolate reductase family protein [Terriglobales bacterium]|nr:dihydrofolate reductase family protein [Terriglobales bacterium]
MKMSVFCGTSVDGFIARPDDTLDFLEAGGGGPHGFTEFLRSVDVVVLGRRTYEVVTKIGHFGLYGKRQIIVLSRTPLDLSSSKAKIEQMSGTPQEIAAQLDKRGFQHAYVDGGITIQRFLQQGLVNRITVTRVPVLIGQGIPLFGPLTKDVPVRHIKTQSYKGGLVQSEYEVGTAPRTSSRKPKAPGRARHKKRTKR